MPLYLPSDNIGYWTKPREVEVTWRETMNFAASIGDNNPAYFDDTREEGIVAPAMLATALTWPIFVHRHEYWGMEGWPEEVVARQVHFTETIIMHRHIYPGDKLAIRGLIYGVVPLKGGVLSQVLFEATNDEGKPVFTEHAGAFYRGVRCPDGGRAVGEIYQAPKAPETEDCLWEVKLHIDPMAAHVYDGCTGLSFPIHTSKRFARSVGLPGPLLQGTATQAMAIREVINREAGGEPTRLKSLSCCFRGMVLLDTDIRVRMLARVPCEEGINLFFEVLNEEGKKAIQDGHVLISG